MELLQLLLLPVCISRMMYLLFEDLYEPRFQRRYIVPALYVVWALLMDGVNLLEIPFLNLFFSIISINILVFVLYRGELRKKVLYTNLYVFVLFFCDALSVAIGMIIKNNSFQYVIDQHMDRMLMSFIDVMLLYFAYCVLIRTIRKEIIKIELKQLAFFMFMVCFELFFIGFYASRSTNGDDGIVMVVMLCVFLLFNMMFMRILTETSQMHQYRYELELVRKENLLQFEHYQELCEKYANSRKVIHDIKKHLAAIMELESTDRERAESYCRMIGEQVEGLFQRFECTNKILEIIMSQKISMAESLGIRVETKIEDCLLEFMSDLDVTAIFANLWDNAIEACKKVEGQEKIISVEMQKKESFLLIYMKNSYDGTMKKKNGRIMSTKKHHEGLGLSIIKTTVEKYHGVLVVKDTEKFFEVRITMPYQE